MTLTVSGISGSVRDGEGIGDSLRGVLYRLTGVEGHVTRRETETDGEFVDSVPGVETSDELGR